MLFRLYYWAKEEMWAAGTILFLAYLLSSYVLGFLLGWLHHDRITFTIYLLAVVAAFTFAQIRIFSGNRQGRLEYGYREHLFVRGQKTTLCRFLKTAPLPSPSFFPERYEQLIGQPQTDDNVAIYAYAKLAEGAFKYLDFQEAAGYLLKALSKAPCSAVINARLAKTYEKMGLSEGAIRHYGAAKEDISNSLQLNAFFDSEASRIRVKGPDEYDWRGGLHRM